jgi:hypothetical protein
MSDQSDETRRLLDRATITPQQLYEAKVLPFKNVNGIYESLARGEIETIRIGRKYAIVCSALRRKLGLD